MSRREASESPHADDTSQADPEETVDDVRGRGRVGSTAGWVVLGLALLAAPLVGRAAWEGRAELRAADAARDQDDKDVEIEHLGRAARWRVPGLSHDEVALDRLETLAVNAQAHGEQDHIALAAHREIRRALLATRSFGVPHPDRFARANAQIAALMAEQERTFQTDSSGGVAADDLEAYHRGLLDRVPGPNPWRANLAGLAFVAWLVTSAGFVLRGLDGEGRLRARPALRWGGGSVVMLVTWAVLLATAN